MHACHACMSCLQACHAYIHVMHACRACMSCMHVMHACHACMHVMHACHAYMSCMHVMYTCRSDNGLASLGQRLRFAHTTASLRWNNGLARAPGWPTFPVAQLGSFFPQALLAGFSFRTGEHKAFAVRKIAATPEQVQILHKNMFGNLLGNMFGNVLGNMKSMKHR